MTLAITGGTGFVGRALIECALAQGHEVKALARQPQPPRAGVAWIAGDLDDGAALHQLVTGAHAVIHVAGRTRAADPAQFEAANVQGTLAVIEAALAAGAGRLVFVSSLAAREPGLSAYGASKARAERLVAATALDWTIVRPPAVYGPGDRDMFELFRAAKWGIVPVPAGGRASLIHVDDLAMAVAGAGFAGRARDGRDARARRRHGRRLGKSRTGVGDRRSDGQTAARARGVAGDVGPGRVVRMGCCGAHSRD